MENQVLSIFQMQELQKLGIDTSIASCFYRWGGIYTTSCEYERTDKDIPTFTLQDILELLPTRLTPKAGEWGDEWRLLLSTASNEIWYWYADYDCRTISFNSDNLLQSAFEMLKWVVENGYLEITKSNKQ